jgi:molecular chaperone DnaJ
VNPGDRVAEDVYRRIQDAYTVLADSERRREYDRAGRPAQEPSVDVSVAFDGFDFTAAVEGAGAATFSELFADVFQHAAREATTPSRGGDIEMGIRVPFMAAMRGAEIPVSVTRQERCVSCGGSGRLARAPRPCAVCGGEGTRRWARGHMLFTKACEACDGRGVISADACRTCMTSGLVSHTQVVTIALPAGVESGTRVAVPGHGHAGARGGRAGDLYVAVDVADHPYFVRVGRDLHLTVPIAVHEAALGARITVPGLDGHIDIRVPAGVESDAMVRVAARGVPSPNGTRDAGDLVVRLRVVLPPRLDDRSKALIEEFGRLNAADVRQSLFDAL